MPSLLNFLTHKTIRHQVGPSGIEIHGSLDLQHAGLTELPEGMTVHGDLDLSGTGILMLPERLNVLGSLLLNFSRIAFLPRTLSVRDNLEMEHSKLIALPPEFHVAGHLILAGTPIETLPEGLEVGGDLRIWDTRIERLPTRLHVGGVIFPPTSLIDIRTFVAQRGGTGSIPPQGSAHQRMQAWPQLQPFPDLWRVAISMVQRYRLIAITDSRGKILFQLDDLSKMRA